MSAVDPAIRIGVFGAAGRMGQRIVACAADDPAVVLACEVDRADAARVDLSDVDVVIDFAVAEATDALLEMLGPTAAALVSGVTGRTPGQEAAIAARAEVAPVLTAANFSVGVAVLRAVVRHAARALGPGWDAEIFETHHRGKADAPSGTALALGADVAAARGLTWPGDRRVRDGRTGAREADTIGTAALRGGDVAGEHTVFLFGDGERLELTHRASHRDIFARGALRAARWIAGRPAGRYGLEDVIAVEY